MATLEKTVVKVLKKIYEAHKILPNVLTTSSHKSWRCRSTCHTLSTLWMV